MWASEYNYLGFESWLLDKLVSQCFDFLSERGKIFYSHVNTELWDLADLHMP